MPFLEPLITSRAASGHPPGRRCHEKYPMSCNVQWRRLELCMEQVQIFESLGHDHGALGALVGEASVHGEW